MKSIRNHLMFILPFMAILLGIESYLVFDRTTNSYEKGLKEGYSMLVVAKKPMNISELKKLNSHINSLKRIERESIVSQIAEGISKSSSKEILASLPYFYSVGLDSYLHTSGLDKIKDDLESGADIKRVETFSSSYSSTYRLFSFIKFVLKISIIFMGLVSFFLIIKQMEVWRYVHEERMKVMEIFGASLMLRSAILFRVAVVDALIAVFLTTLIFLYMKYLWVANSGIDIIIQNKEDFFQFTDILILFLSALFVAIISVYCVVFSSSGVQE